MKQKIYTDYIQDILNSIEEIENFSTGLSFNKFMRDKKTINAVIRSLEVIGEASKNIPKQIRNNHPDIPWAKMAGMRDKLIHEYFGIDLEIIWQTIKRDIPTLKPLIIKLKDKI
jgi:uncharacterized protein with HEPN domain